MTRSGRSLTYRQQSSRFGAPQQVTWRIPISQTNMTVREAVVQTLRSRHCYGYETKSYQCSNHATRWCPPTYSFSTQPSSAVNSPCMRVSRRYIGDQQGVRYSSLSSGAHLDRARGRLAKASDTKLLLYEKLRELDISYQLEDDLRAAGYSKTPDVKMDVPIGVHDRMVNWIDSKACSFGDERIRKTQGSDQCQRYMNKFGLGIVIYWFGYIYESRHYSDGSLVSQN